MKNVFRIFSVIGFVVASTFFFVMCKTSGKESDIKISNKPYNIIKSETYNSAAVVSAHYLASTIGKDIIQKGGNAIDAAIAIQFALAVTYPIAGNIGGGGFMIYRSKDGLYDALDFRESAPALAHKDMYLDAEKNVDTS